MRRVSNTNNEIRREVLMTSCRQGNEVVAVTQEVEDPVMTSNTDRVGTARTRKKWDFFISDHNIISCAHTIL